MTEQLHFSELWPHWPELLAGLWVTVQLTVLATIGGLAIGILGAAIRSGRPGILSRIWGGYGDPQRSPGNAQPGMGRICGNHP